MQIELLSLNAVTPYPNNPRINDSAVDSVCKSLKEYGFRQPIVVDPEMVIIVGHTRYKAAQKLGLEKIPVHIARDLSPDQIRAYRIADNQTATLADWNYDLLPIELGKLHAENYDMSLLGFDDDELAKLIKDELATDNTDVDEVPAPPDDPTTRPGDIWILGNHRLMCGDSSKWEQVEQLLAGARIQLVNSDPPYNVKVEPRSNNAIAAGNSLFTKEMYEDPKKGKKKRTHHQSLDLALHPEKSQPTTKQMRAKDRPLANDFVSEEEFDRLLDA